MVIYDMVSIPLLLFNPEETVFLQMMAWTSPLFWSLDMIASFCTGVITEDGRTCMKIPFIAKRYLQTWFGLDLLIVASTWLEFIVTGADGVGVIGSLGKYIRIVRIVRLLRLARMKQVMKQVTERIQSDRLAFVVFCLQLLTCVLFFSHILG